MTAKKINAICLVLMIIIGSVIIGCNITASKTGMSSNYSKTVRNLADKVTVGCETDTEKVKAIYNYVISNYTYDYDASVIFQYVNIEKTIESKKGICFDFSQLFAALCRMNDIPCVIISGEDENDRHTWNRCCIDGKWYEVDLTNDIVVYSTGEGIYYGFVEIEGRDAPAEGYRIYSIL